MRLKNLVQIRARPTSTTTFSMITDLKLGEIETTSIANREERGFNNNYYDAFLKDGPRRWSDTVNFLYNHHIINKKEQKLFHLQVLLFLHKGAWDFKTLQKFSSATPKLLLDYPVQEVEEVKADIEESIRGNNKLSLGAQELLIADLDEKIQANTTQDDVKQVAVFENTIPPYIDTTDPLKVKNEMMITGVDSFQPKL